MESLYGIKVVWANWQRFDENYWKKRIHFSREDRGKYTFVVDKSKLLLYIGSPEKVIVGYYITEGDWFYDATNPDHPYAIPVNFTEGKNPINLELLNQDFFKNFPEQGRGYYPLKKETYNNLEKILMG
ncbi:hypothetical protein [Bacillus sp. FJAT-27445]|uniref:hypothetical protein n=1 Tax=Bacillus sp. FJAT-27445 TaxID=1679166 RepID=UPI0007436488|nr:hypothetical protein [Bacillus sp. FJAT-27445]